MKIKDTNAPAFCRHLQAIAKLANHESPYAFEVWGLLVRIEKKAHRITTALMEEDNEDLQNELEKIEKKVRRILPNAKTVFINRDARGYALKLKESEAKETPGLHSDFGGYGILAPEF
jgi:hypothetical protein